MSRDSKIRIGILGAADIAFRRFLPALSLNDKYEFAGVAIATSSERLEAVSSDRHTGTHKAEEIVSVYGGRVYESFMSMLEDDSIDAVYIPLPPTLHYKWGEKAICCGKNVYMEKPFTTSYEDTKTLIELAKEHGVAIFENYVFDTHEQFTIAKKYIEEGTIGAIRQIRCSFGFPYRGEHDFRYDGKLGGGAILDAGGYLMKCMGLLTNGELTVKACELRSIKNHDVDGYGTALVTDSDGVIGVLTFGMDQQYRCELELWGENGLVTFNRFYTPAANYAPQITITKGFEVTNITVDPFDTFAGGIAKFADILDNKNVADETMKNILRQAGYVQMLLDKGIYE